MMDRRTALKHIGSVASALLLTETLKGQALPAGQPAASTAPPTGPFTLPPLPYAYDALEPSFDAETMHLHHDKHHQAYVNNLNAAVAAHPELAGKTVEELITNLSSLPESVRTAVRNNGGGHANHSFWWPILCKPGSAIAPTGELSKAVDLKFGSLSAFQDKLTAAALSVFGSGWAWLVKLPDGSVAIETTPNQDSPFALGYKPVLGVDVWEHAYYLKYQNRRVEYVRAFYQVLNWDYVSAQFAQKA
ncbi:MAG: superoxide dismutase [Terracidiphilus sp.]